MAEEGRMVCTYHYESPPSKITLAGNGEASYNKQKT